MVQLRVPSPVTVKPLIDYLSRLDFDRKVQARVTSTSIGEVTRFDSSSTRFPGGSSAVEH
jgi:hypothetical protein